MHGDTRQQDEAHHEVPEERRRNGREGCGGNECDPDAVERSEHETRLRPGGGFVNRVAAGLVMVALAACSALPAGVTPTFTPTSTLPAPSTTSQPTTTTTMVTTTTTNPGPPLGLMTPNGIPVAVRFRVPEGYMVWSPCGVLTRVSGGTPLYGTAVVLDPGHGGDRDIGAQGRNGLPEKVANLRVAFAAQAELQSRGIPTVLTRTADYATTLRTRTHLADHLGAQVLVSIHHNAPTPGPSPTPGTEIFMQSGSEESRRLGGVLYGHVVDALSRFTEVEWSAAPDAGVLTVLNDRGIDTYGMIRLPETPAVLLEMGYMSNPSEADLFATEEYVEVAGRAIADALEAYLTTDEPGRGWYEPGRQFTASPGLTQAGCVDTPLE